MFRANEWELSAFLLHNVLGTDEVRCEIALEMNNRGNHLVTNDWIVVAGSSCPTTTAKKQHLNAKVANSFPIRVDERLLGLIWNTIAESMTLAGRETWSRSPKHNAMPNSDLEPLSSLTPLVKVSGSISSRRVIAARVFSHSHHFHKIHGD